MKLFDRLGKLRDRRRPYCTMIVPAAGESRRMGGGNKLLLPLEGGAGAGPHPPGHRRRHAGG